MAWDALLGDVGAVLLSASLAAVVWLVARGWGRREAESGAARLLRLSDALSAAAVGGWLVGRAAAAAGEAGCAGGGWPGAGAAGASGHAFWAAAARGGGGGRSAAALAAAAWLWLAIATTLTPQDACMPPPLPTLPQRDGGLLRTAEDTVARVKDIVRTLLQQLSTSDGNASTAPHHTRHRVQKRSLHHTARLATNLTDSHHNTERSTGGNTTSITQPSFKPSDTVLRTQRLRRAPCLMLSSVKSVDKYITNVKENEKDDSVTKAPLVPRYCTTGYDFPVRVIICPRRYNRSSTKVRLRNTRPRAQRRINTRKLEALAALCCSKFSLKLEVDVWHKKLWLTFPRVRLKDFTHHLLPREIIIPRIFCKCLPRLNAKGLILALPVKDALTTPLCSIIIERRKIQAQIGTTKFYRNGNGDIMAKLECNLQRKSLSNKSSHSSETHSKQHMTFQHLFKMCLKGHIYEKYQNLFRKSLQQVLISRLSKGNRKFSGKAVRQFIRDKRQHTPRKFISNFDTRSTSRDIAMISGNKHKRHYKCQMKRNTSIESDYQSRYVLNCLFPVPNNDKFPPRFVKQYPFLKITNCSGSKEAVQRCWKYNTENDINKNKNRVKRGVRKTGVKKPVIEGHPQAKPLFPRDSDDNSQVAFEDQTTDTEALIDGDEPLSDVIFTKLNFTVPETVTPELPSKLSETTFASTGTLSDAMDVVTAATISNTDEEPDTDNYTGSPTADPMEHTERITTTHLETVHSQVEPLSPVQFQTTSESSPVQHGGSATDGAEIITSTDLDTDEVTWWPPLVSAGPENTTSDADCRCQEPPSDSLVAAVLLLLGHVAPLVWAAAARCGCGRWRRLSSGLELALWLPGLLGAASRAAGVEAPALRGAAGRAATAAGLCGALLRVAHAALATAPTVRQAPRCTQSAPAASGTSSRGWVEAEAVEAGAAGAGDRGGAAGEARSRPGSGGGGPSEGGTTSGGGTGAQGSKLSPQLEAVFVVGSKGPCVAGPKAETPQESLKQNSESKSLVSSNMPKFLRDATAFLLKRRKAVHRSATRLNEDV